MTLYEEWMSRDFRFKSRLHFNLVKHSCSVLVNPLTTQTLIAGTQDWKADVKALYERYANTIPPSKNFSANFITANINKVNPLLLSEDFTDARVALEAYIFLHWLKGDIKWEDSSIYYVKICPDCIITREMLS